MSLAILGLTSGFMLVLVFLFYLTLKTSIQVWVKLLAVLVVSVFYIIQFESLQQYTGWPSTDNLPEKFILIAADVREPDQKTGEKGVMYWLVRDSTDKQQPPRVFELPYQVEVHKKAEQVISEQKKGSQYIGRISENKSASAANGIGFEKVSKVEYLKKTIKK